MKDFMADALKQIRASFPVHTLSAGEYAQFGRVFPGSVRGAAGKYEVENVGHTVIARTRGDGCNTDTLFFVPTLKDAPAFMLSYSEIGKYRHARIELFDTCVRATVRSDPSPAEFLKIGENLAVFADDPVFVQETDTHDVPEVYAPPVPSVHLVPPVRKRVLQSEAIFLCAAFAPALEEALCWARRADTCGDAAQKRAHLETCARAFLLGGDPLLLPLQKTLGAEKAERFFFDFVFSDNTAGQSR